MLMSDIGDDTYRWLDDRLQACHLSHLGDTRLEDGQFSLLTELPYR